MKNKPPLALAKAVCPKCRLHWFVRVLAPKKCPRCGKRLVE